MLFAPFVLNTPVGRLARDVPGTLATVEQGFRGTIWAIDDASLAELRPLQLRRDLVLDEPKTWKDLWVPWS